MQMWSSTTTTDKINKWFIMIHNGLQDGITVLN